MNNATTSLYFDEGKCTPEGNKWHYILLMPLPIIAGCLNLLVWLAASIYRTKLLRQSYVYSCVSSTLLSNALFLSFHLWEEIAGYMRPNSVYGGPPGEKMQILWALCQAAAISMLFVMCGNLSVLIYVMLDSRKFSQSYRKRACSHSSEKNTKIKVKTTEKLESKRQRAAFLVIICWLIPLALTIAAVISWNCASSCRCPPGAKEEVCPRNQGCSRMWTPMTNSFLAVNVALWFFDVVTLIAVTVSGIRGSQVSQVRNPINNAVSRILSAESRGRSLTSESTANFDEFSGNQRGLSADKDKGPDDVFNAKPPTRKITRLNPRLRLIAMLSSVFILGTILVPIAFFIDIGADSFNVPAIRIPSMILVQVYTLLCPIILIKYMSSLKAALARLMSTIFFCF
ncbi:uncharacterized protein LOC143464910 [Clavelina lepadiformis]|uniref:uncharacterized protein LOC143464910 n=1 Tax=Clavelina lepadiformis TaxID=159417 RepID=UPI0040430D3C